RPVINHTTRSQPGAPTCLEISAGTMKMPVPIIEPATIIVESSKPRPRTNPVVLSVSARTFVDMVYPDHPGRSRLDDLAGGQLRYVQEFAIFYSRLQAR